VRNQVDIDVALSRAIIREIGERLQALLGEDELRVLNLGSIGSIN
jgi:hypothetical protein